jgi:hypothetical protein
MRSESHFHRTVLLRSAFPHAMLTMEIFMMPSVNRLASRRRHRGPVHYQHHPLEHSHSSRELRTSTIQKPKRRLIATHTKLEFVATHSKHRASHFLIATKNTVLDLSCFNFRGACVPRHTRPRRFQGSSNPPKQSPGHASNHHKMPGLRFRHHPLREAR